MRPVEYVPPRPQGKLATDQVMGSSPERNNFFFFLSFFFFLRNIVVVFTIRVVPTSSQYLDQWASVH